MSESLTFLERLEIQIACERLIYVYVEHLDRGDLDDVANCFVSEGALARPMTPEQTIQGRDAILASLRTRPKTLLTRHLTSNVMIEVESRDTARAVSYLTMIGCTATVEGTPPHQAQGPLYFGEFRDRFVRRDGEWKFLERRGAIQIKY